MAVQLRRVTLAIVGTMLLAGCTNATDGVVCTAVLVSGIVVEVRDSVSGADLAGVRGAVRDAAYVDSLRGSAGGTTFAAAGERAGTYTVEVVRPGYRTFTRAGVVVTRDACHVRTQHVRAALAPST